MDAPAAIASHVAFEVDRAWVDDVTAALAEVAAGTTGRLGVVLERWWARREARLAAATTALDDAVRAELGAAFAGDELFVELTRTAPAVVRRDALGQLRRVAPRLRALIAIDAPMIVLDRERETSARLLDELDPAARREPVPTPVIGAVPDAGGAEVADLTLWLDRMLVAAQVDAPSVGLGEAFGARPEAVAFLAGAAPAADAAAGAADAASAASAASVRIWPGMSTLAVHPDLAFWASPAVALPHRIAVPGTPPALVAAEASGPITYALAGDAPGPALVPALAARVRDLAGGRALVSFVWLATDAAGPWRPIG